MGCCGSRVPTGQDPVALCLFFRRRRCADIPVKSLPLQPTIKTKTVNYKILFQKVASILAAPARSWSVIAEYGQGRTVMNEYVYPLIGLCGLCEFVGTFIGKELSSVMVQVALTRGCAVAGALFGGFFLAVSLLEHFTRYWYGWKGDTDRMQLFVGYAMTVTYVLTMVSGLMPIVLLHWVLQLYTLVLVFEGARRLIGIRENRLTSYTVWASLILIACPVVIKYIFNKLSVILN